MAKACQSGQYGDNLSREAGEVRIGRLSENWALLSPGVTALFPSYLGSG